MWSYKDALCPTSKLFPIKMRNAWDFSCLYKRGCFIPAILLIKLLNNSIISLFPYHPQDALIYKRLKLQQCD